MLSMEITRLIEQCRQGDVDALGELYKAYAQKMRGVCRRYISDEQTVEDVLHDAFVIIFTSFDRLRDVHRAEAWMAAITRNVASKCKSHLEALPTVSFDDTNEVELIAIENEERDVRGVPLNEVVRMIDRLPEGYGQVFRLSVFEGMSHKEIADMLGIEPHSSSSQLARAKKMLRKMMQQYWAAVLLILLVPITLFLFKRSDLAVKSERTVVAKQKRSEGEHQASSKESPKGRTQVPVVIHLPTRHTTIVVADAQRSVIIQTADTTQLDTLSGMVAQQQMKVDTITTDSTQAIRNVEKPNYNIAELFPGKSTVDIYNEKKWSVELAYTGGYGEQDVNRPYSFIEIPMTAATGEPLPPVAFEKWSDYAAYLSELPDEVTSQTRRVVMKIALNNANQPGNDKIVRTSHHQMPVTWSLMMKYRLNNRFGLESGLSYSRLTSTFETGVDGNAIREQQTIHYIGIPVKGIYNVYNGGVWSMYGSFGITMEMPVYSPLHTSYYLHSSLEGVDKTTIHAPWQWSVGTGLGLQYNFTPSIGLFAEPSLRYYIPAGSIETYRTEHPFMFSLPLGIRFTW